MSRALTRPDGRPKAPVRIVHLGLGNFCRAHTCWYTDHSPDAADWGIAAFAGRTATHVAELTAQDDLYTLLVRGPEPTAEVISALSAVHVAAELDAWRAYWADPSVRVVTSTITEGGYLRDAAGNLDRSLPAVQADLSALRAEPLTGLVTTAPGKFVAGLLARRAAGAGGVTLLPCDNVVSSGPMIATVVRQMAEAVDPGLLDWIDQQVGVVSAMVDRITPATRPEDTALAESLTGCADAATVVTEPFTEWVMQGDFAAGRPAWQAGGARFVDDIEPFEQRKLRLLNGAHSLMAYIGPLRGHATVPQAIADPVIQRWVEDWWAEASGHLPLPAPELADYCRALLDRFSNRALGDQLSRIAADGSQKLPIRIVPTVQADLAAGRDATAGLRVVAAWICHLRGQSTAVTDARQAEVLALGDGSIEQSATKVLGFLGLPLDLTGNVRQLVTDLGR